VNIQHIKDAISLAAQLNRELEQIGNIEFTSGSKAAVEQALKADAIANRISSAIDKFIAS
jgi:hypothetical protein